jgi:hypothetical protein
MPSRDDDRTKAARQERMHADGAAPEPDDGVEPAMHADGATLEPEPPTKPVMDAQGAVPEPADRPEPRMTATGSTTDEPTARDPDDEEPEPPASPE